MEHLNHQSYNIENDYQHDASNDYAEKRRDSILQYMKLGTIKRFVKVHTFNPYYYFDYLEKNSVYFGSPNKVGDIRIPKPFIHVIFQGIICSIWFVRCLIAILAPPHIAQWTATVLLPKNEAKKFELTLIFWSLSNMIYSFWVLPTKLKYFKFMAPFALSVEGRIRPENLGLGEDQYDMLSRFRNRALKLYLVTTSVISSGAVIAPMIKYMFIFSEITVAQRFVYFFVLQVLSIWVVYVDLGYYGLPALIMTICYYLILKCRALIDRMKSVIKLITPRRWGSILDRLSRIHGEQAFLMREMKNYSFAIRRGMSATFLIYIALMTYTTYLVLFTYTPPEFMLLFGFISVAQIIFLGSMIYLCSKISAHNLKMSEKTLQFYNSANQLRLLRSKEAIKIEFIIQSLANYSSGFTLMNSMRIDSKSYYVVVYNISLFFFLVFKKGT